MRMGWNPCAGACKKIGAGSRSFPYENIGLALEEK